MDTKKDIPQPKRNSRRRNKTEKRKKYVNEQPCQKILGQKMTKSSKKNLVNIFGLNKKNYKF